MKNARRLLNHYLVIYTEKRVNIVMPGKSWTQLIFEKIVAPVLYEQIVNQDRLHQASVWLHELEALPQEYREQLIVVPRVPQHVRNALNELREARDFHQRMRLLETGTRLEQLSSLGLIAIDGRVFRKAEEQLLKHNELVPMCERYEGAKSLIELGSYTVGVDGKAELGMLLTQKSLETAGEVWQQYDKSVSPWRAAKDANIIDNAALLSQGGYYTAASAFLNRVKGKQVKAPIVRWQNTAREMFADAQSVGSPVNENVYVILRKIIRYCEEGYYEGDLVVNEAKRKRVQQRRIDYLGTESQEFSAWARWHIAAGYLQDETMTSCREGMKVIVALLLIIADIPCHYQLLAANLLANYYLSPHNSEHDRPKGYYWRRRSQPRAIKRIDPFKLIDYDPVLGSLKKLIAPEVDPKSTQEYKSAGVLPTIVGGIGGLLYGFAKVTRLVVTKVIETGLRGFIKVGDPRQALDSRKAQIKRYMSTSFARFARPEGMLEGEAVASRSRTARQKNATSTAGPLIVRARDYAWFEPYLMLTLPGGELGALVATFRDTLVDLRDNWAAYFRQKEQVSLTRIYTLLRTILQRVEADAGLQSDLCEDLFFACFDIFIRLNAVSVPYFHSLITAIVQDVLPNEQGFFIELLCLYAKFPASQAYTPQPEAWLFDVFLRPNAGVISPESIVTILNNLFGEEITPEVLPEWLYKQARVANELPKLKRFILGVASALLALTHSLKDSHYLGLAIDRFHVIPPLKLFGFIQIDWGDDNPEASLSLLQAYYTVLEQYGFDELELLDQLDIVQLFAGLREARLEDVRNIIRAVLLSKVDDIEEARKAYQNSFNQKRPYTNKLINYLKQGHNPNLYFVETTTDADLGWFVSDNRQQADTVEYALHSAIRHLDVPLIMALLNYGADVTKKNIHGLQPLQYLLYLHGPSASQDAEVRDKVRLIARLVKNSFSWQTYINSPEWTEARQANYFNQEAQITPGAHAKVEEVYRSTCDTLNQNRIEYRALQQRLQGDLYFELGNANKACGAYLQMPIAWCSQVEHRLLAKYAQEQGEHLHEALYLLALSQVDLTSTDWERLSELLAEIAQAQWGSAKVKVIVFLQLLCMRESLLLDLRHDTQGEAEFQQALEELESSLPFFYIDGELTEIKAMFNSGWLFKVVQSWFARDELGDMLTATVASDDDGPLTYKFYRVPIEPDGDCALHTMGGVTRQNYVNALLHYADDPELRRILSNEIKGNSLAGEYEHPDVAVACAAFRHSQAESAPLESQVNQSIDTSGLSIDELLAHEDVSDEDKLRLTRMQEQTQQALANLDQVCANQAVFCHYVETVLRNAGVFLEFANDIGDVASGSLAALAYLQGKGLRVWEKEGESVKLARSYLPIKADSVVDVLFCPASPSGKESNHYDLLIPPFDCPQELLITAAGANLIMLAIDSNDENALEQWLDSSLFDAQAMLLQRDMHGNNALLHALRQSNTAFAKRLLQTPVATRLVEQANDAGESALLFAARYADLEAVEAIMQVPGFDKSQLLASDSEGNTAFHWAAKRGDFAILDKLHGGDFRSLKYLQAKNQQGETVLQAGLSHPSFIVDVLSKLKEFGQRDIRFDAARPEFFNKFVSEMSYEAVLAKRDADGNTLLMQAVNEGYVDTALAILKSGCVSTSAEILSATNAQQQNLLHLAILTASRNIVNAIIRQPSYKPSLLLAQVDSQGHTPAALARELGQIVLARKLDIEAGYAKNQGLEYVSEAGDIGAGCSRSF